MSIATVTEETIQNWELITPEGGVTVKPIKFVDRLPTLDGKTVLLRWNGKPNGDLFLNRVAELLSEKGKNIKIIRAYEVAPETSIISHGLEKSVLTANKLLSYNPDIVISAQCD